VKTSINRLLLTISVGLLTVLSSFCVLASKNQTFSIVNAYTNNDAATYYKDVDNSMNESELLSTLRTIQNNRLKSRVGYNSMPSYFSKTDKGSNGLVMAFYDGGSYSYSKMNREHVWPASRTVGGRKNDPLEDDINMVRPTLDSDNSSRGNAFYVQDGKTSEGWDPANCGNETYRGDSSRIVMYCVIADSRLSLVDKNNDSSNNYTMGKLSDLLAWNLKYPVTEREKTRNEEAEKLQGNRNPFIDHPEYACKIWGRINETTMKVCGYDKTSGITLDSKTRTLAINKSVRLTYTLLPEGRQDDVIWESSNSHVASVSNDGLVTTLSPGTSSITVYTNDRLNSDTCVFTVLEDESASNASNGCSGNVISTSVILSTIALLGAGTLLIRKLKDE